MIVMIGMTSILTLIIYGRYSRQVVFETVGEKMMYVMGIMTNQGKNLKVNWK